MKLYKGDCILIMDQLIEEGIKVDAIIFDPPYGMTECGWDKIIPFDEMWERLKRIRKDYAPILIFGKEPFSSMLRMSNIDEFKYDWIWEKSRASGFAHAKNKPLVVHEIISMFSNGVTIHESQTNKRVPYNPQGLIEVQKPMKNSASSMNASRDSVFAKRKGVKENYIQEYENYPRSVLKFENAKNPVHRTQKPVPLLEYMIETYTEEGDTVLDITMGSGTCGVAAAKTFRNFIGIEADHEIFNDAKAWIEHEYNNQQTKLF